MEKELFLLLTFLMLPFPVHVAGNQTHLYDEEHIVEQMLLNYDRRILPTKDGSPVTIEVRANVVDMAEQKTIHSHYGIEIVLHSFWNDHRLAYNTSDMDDIRLAAGKVDLIWTPDFTFEEKIGIASKITTENKFVALYKNGDILFSQRVILTMFCPMDFTRFPFDDQECSMPIMSSAYNDEQMKLDWMSTSGGKTLPGLVFRRDLENLGGPFLIEDYSYGKAKRQFGTSESYDELKIELKFHRRLSYYFVRIYLPLILIVILSFGAFWIDYRSTPARTIMATTIVLTVVTFNVSIQSSLPPTTSIRSVDLYSLGCFIFVFASLVEYAFVQTVDIQVRIVERKLEGKNEGPEMDKGKVAGKGRHKSRGSSVASISPEREVDLDAIPEMRAHGIFGGLVTRIYKAHWKHREEYHILDHISKRAFPLTFGLLNAIYFGVYTSHG